MRDDHAARCRPNGPREGGIGGEKQVAGPLCAYCDGLLDVGRMPSGGIIKFRLLPVLPAPTASLAVFKGQ